MVDSGRPKRGRFEAFPFFLADRTRLVVVPLDGSKGKEEEEEEEEEEKEGCIVGCRVDFLLTGSRCVVVAFDRSVEGKKAETVVVVVVVVVEEEDTELDDVDFDFLPKDDARSSSFTLSPFL